MRFFARRSTVLVLAVLISLTSQAFAQKKKLTPEDYAQWQRLGQTILSPDGNWFAYQIIPVEGDGWVTVTNVASGVEHELMYAGRGAFSNNNGWFAFAIGVSEDEEKKLTEAKKTVEYKLGIMDLTTAVVDTFEFVQSFSFSDDGNFLAMRKYKAEGVKTKGTDLVVRNLEAGTNQGIGNVAEYAFSEEGAHLAVIIEATGKLGNGVQLMDLTNGLIRILESDEEIFTGLSWAEESMSLAFMKEQEKSDFDDANHLVYAFSDLDGAMVRKVFDSEAHAAFPDGFRIAAEGDLMWSDDGRLLFMGLKEWEPAGDDEDDAEEGSEEDSEEGADDKEPSEGEDAESKKKTIAERDADLDPPGVDIWHWNDTRIQPRQQVQATRDRQFTYFSAWSIGDDAFVKIADKDRKNATLTGDQKYAVLYDPTPYEPAFRESWQDVYTKDVQSGEETKVLVRIEIVQTSPDGQYLVYFRDNDWWSYGISSGRHTNLTADIPARFNNFKAINGRESDRQWGSGQWAEGDEWFLVYDEYDVYRLNPDGSNAERLTYGADDRIRFRQVRLDFEEDALDPDAPIYFSAYGDFTKDSGYYRLDNAPATDQDPRLNSLIYEPRSISRLMRARDADIFVFQTQKADESPNYYLVDERFRSPRQLTDTNPWQDDYEWAHTELMTYTNANGVELQGRLLYPAHYESGKKYPMMVYIYELRSQSLHSYTLPGRTSAYNQRRYSSEGYFVFEPDIVYRLRDPGMSAVECVVPAVEEVLASGMIDEEKIGLTGHSWGAYQTSFVVSQTDLFAAAVAGAPLTNMISMYNSIYWNSGSTDAQIFEISQGRFPDPYWEDWDKFVENSPIFNAQTINTPLMIAFGDEDGAVDFNQGVEMYSTMRRLKKPFIMLVYEGENHGNRKKENQIDYANRTHDWFNHFLLGQEPAEWITNGIPFLEKELEKKKQKEAKKKETSE